MKELIYDGFKKPLLSIVCIKNRSKYICWRGEWVNIALRRFQHNYGNIATEEGRIRDYALYSYRMTSRVLYSAQYHRQHRTFQAFEQFGPLYKHNLDDKYPTPPGFEPSTSEFWATTGSNEPSGLSR